MENKQLLAKFSNITKFNSQFSKCNVAVAYHGDNRNFSSISKDVFEKMIPSLYGIPVVGEWKEENEDFGSHGGKLEISDEGIKYVETTKPFGFIDSQAKVWWENVTEEDGTVHEYLFTECFLWTGRYPESEKVLEGNSNQSMEIFVKSGNEREDGYFEITDAEFSALCILGSQVEPAFESSGFKQFNLDKETFKTEFNLMVKELKQSLFEGGEGVEDKKFEEDVVETTEETTEEFIETTEESTEDVEETTVDTSEETEETTEEFNEEVAETTEEEVEEKFTKVFELSHDDIRLKLYGLLYEVEEEDDDWYYINEVFDNYFVYSGYKKIYKQGYIKTDVDVAFEGERVEMFIEYLTAEELEELNNMRNNYSLILSENEDLKSFKSNILAQQKSNEVEEVFNKYSTLLDVVDFEDLKENAINMEIAELEKELSFRLVQKKFDFSKVTKKDSTKITIKETKDNNEPYGSASIYFNK